MAVKYLIFAKGREVANTNKLVDARKKAKKYLETNNGIVRIFKQVELVSKF